MQANRPTKRFSNRVTSYVTSRPGYPQPVYDFIKLNCNLRDEAIVVDVGSGTGLRALLFLTQGHHVIGVEPSAEMRGAGEAALTNFPNFSSLEGSAEALPLADTQADLIVAGQAFHWFGAKEFRKESQRVAKPKAKAAPIWNDWSPKLSPFLRDYDSLLREFGTDYDKVSRQHRRVGRSIETYFVGIKIQEASFSNIQTFDYAGLKGRLLSSSSVSLQGSPAYKPILARLEELFRIHSDDQRLQFDYQARVYLGMIGSNE